jgi:hypothetical protein
LHDRARFLPGGGIGGVEDRSGAETDAGKGSPVAGIGRVISGAED